MGDNQHYAWQVSMVIYCLLPLVKMKKREVLIDGPSKPPLILNIGQ